MVNDDIIRGYEREVVAWICKNYKQLGYDKILVENIGKGPDFIMLRKGKKVRVEVEIYASSFKKHKHDPKDVDGVLCVVKDSKLPVRTIQIKQLILWYLLPADELVDFFKTTHEALLINHKTKETVYHFGEDWLNLSPSEEKRIREELRQKDASKGISSKFWRPKSYQARLQEFVET